MSDTESAGIAKQEIDGFIQENKKLAPQLETLVVLSRALSRLLTAPDNAFVKTCTEGQQRTTNLADSLAILCDSHIDGDHTAFRSILEAALHDMLHILANPGTPRELGDGRVSQARSIQKSKTILTNINARKNSMPRLRRTILELLKYIIPLLQTELTKSSE